MRNWIILASLPVVAASVAALNSRGQQQPPTQPAAQNQPDGGNAPMPPPHDGDERGPRGPRGGPDGRGPEGRGPDGRGPEGRGPMGGPEGRGPMGGPMGRGGPGGPGGPGGRGGPDFPMDMRRPPTMDTQRGYMALVNGYVELSRDSTASGIASVLTAADVLKPRGNSAAIEYFNNLLGSVKDPAIERAIRLQLVDLHRATNQSDEALKHLEKLITAEPSAAK